MFHSLYFPPTQNPSFWYPQHQCRMDTGYGSSACEKQGTIYINTLTSSSLKQCAGLSTPLSFDLMHCALAGSALSAIRAPDPPHPARSQVFPSTWNLMHWCILLILVAKRSFSFFFFFLHCGLLLWVVLFFFSRSFFFLFSTNFFCCLTV